jgi:tetratricopeptide (TPR) repeat protein
MAVDDASPGEGAVALRRYTPAMLAELLDVPVAAIRRWRRRGLLRDAACVRQLAYFNFEEVAVARRLAALLHAGCSLRTIERRLAEFARLAPGVDRPWADPTVVVDGRRLFRRRGDDLAEPGGQLLLDFDGAEEAIEPASVVAPRPGEAVAPAPPALDELLEAALEWEDQGRLDRAADAYRALLLAGGPRAEVHFALADVLYRAGDLAAARERYYAALEIDEKFVEARANLGCLLVEEGELELAAATFEGALVHHPEFADVHYHLAQLLDRLGRGADAAAHFEQFLALAPENPWATAARERLAAGALAAH